MNGMDLFVLAADLDMTNTLEGLLSRPRDLGIRDVTFVVGHHPGRDGGCRTGSVEFLRPYLEIHDHALIVFDRHGCGDRGPRRDIQQSVEDRLARNGWGGRAKAIVIDPELEAWVWSASPAVSRILGWGSRYPALQQWLKDQELWPRGHSKPPDPKRAMRAVMQARRIRLSPRRFSELAENADFADCRDPAFNELRQTLRAWFPPGAAP